MSEFDRLASFRNGTTNLAEAIAFYLEQSGAPFELRQAYVSALARYKMGVFSDLAEPFGIQLSKREKNAMERLGFVSEVKSLVDDLAKEGWPKNNPATYDSGTAFHKAGELMGMEGSSVFTIYYKE